MSAPTTTMSARINKSESEEGGAVKEGGAATDSTGDKKDFASMRARREAREAASSGGSTMSDYTSQRLAELRLRRAESAADSYSDYKSRSSSVATKSSAAKDRDMTSSSFSEYDYKSRRKDPDLSTSTTSGYSSTSTTITSSSSFKLDPRLEPNYQYKSGSRTSLSSTNSKEDSDSVGFATLPEQVHRKAIKRGFDFTLMVVGESGLGKSTLISSLFLNDLYKDRKVPPVHERVTKTVQIEKKYMEIEERGVKLRLTVVDTPGFNDSMNEVECWKPIDDYVNSQFEQFFKDESGLNRKNIKDNRVHCCLYFISPLGHGLRQIDVQFMKHLHDKVNIVPVIAKADTLTPSELRKLKDRVLEQIEKHRIQIYQFPECDSDEDEDFKKQDAELKASIPFSVIGSNTIVEVNGRRVRGRLYPWGIVEVDSPAHCDFLKLKQMLISTHMQDLKDVTRDIHYETYRARYISDQMRQSSRDRNNSASGSPHYALRPENKSLHPSMGVTVSKLKRDSSPNFEAIADTDKLLQQKDDEIRKMQEMLSKMQAQLQNQQTAPTASVNGLKNL